MKLKEHWAHNIQLSPFEVVMMLLSLISVIIILSMVLIPMDKETHKLLFFIDTGICCIFLGNFFIGLLRAPDKRLFLKEHWIDFVASIPAIEPLRFARLFQILRVVRLLRMSRSVLGVLLKQRRQTTMASLLLAIITIVAFSSVLVLLVENGEPGANITTAEDAIWWSLVTISTVGYGDFYPVSTVGHIIGGLVILCGVSFFGVISGYMASLFVAPDEQEHLEQQRQEFKHQLDDVLQRMEHNQQTMLQEISQLKQELQQQHKNR
ncbi:ion transporter [Shewanella sp. YIC-542]|uniref:ion transporter n=1 Tax=Shewanella mytili TaxID=3377111 RepID=UPI00398E8466